MYVETHAHLNDSAFDSDQAAVIDRAFSRGVGRLIEIACSAREWKPAEALCARYPGKITATFGIHPQEAGETCQVGMTELSGYLEKDCCSGLGEIGLDYFWDNSKKSPQLELLETQLELSNASGRICVFHARNGKDAGADNAYADLSLALKRKWTLNNRKRARGVLHCFSGEWADAKAGLDLGLFLGINGTFTYKKNTELRETVRKAGLANIVLETDCPYLPVQEMRGKRNDPSYIPDIAASAASYLGMSTGRLAEATSANASELFYIL